MKFKKTDLFIYQTDSCFPSLSKYLRISQIILLGNKELHLLFSEEAISWFGLG